VTQIPSLVQLPAPVSTRRVARAQFDAIVSETQSFGSQLIFSDGLMGGKFSDDLATALKLPRFVRSHNIEHAYWQRLLKAAKGASRLKLALRLRHLERFETDVLRTARQFFDISTDDLAYWRSRGLTNGVWLPALAADERFAMPCALESGFDVAFVGNLRTSNNVDRVKWLLAQALPIVAARLGRMPRVLIAGSQPTAEILSVCGTVPNLEVRPDFDDVAEVLPAAKVFVSPMLNASGLAMKTVDMLRTGRPVVSTSSGVIGFPPEVKRLTRIADTPQAFADSICTALTDGYSQDQVEVVKAMFGQNIIKRLIERIAVVINGEP
jgi:polysaccharide biosynthesis protein PslH